MNLPCVFSQGRFSCGKNSVLPTVLTLTVFLILTACKKENNETRPGYVYEEIKLYNYFPLPDEECFYSVDGLDGKHLFTQEEIIDNKLLAAKVDFAYIGPGPYDFDYTYHLWYLVSPKILKTYYTDSEYIHDNTLINSLAIVNSTTFKKTPISKADIEEAIMNNTDMSSYITQQFQNGEDYTYAEEETPPFYDGAYKSEAFSASLYGAIIAFKTSTDRVGLIRVRSDSYPAVIFEIWKAL